MPEIKNNFLQGKMNKDLDERLLPNGQYRDALNVEVSTSESSNVGVVKNIIGNHRLENIIPSGYRCVGSVADEKTNKLYWFISSYGKDAIVEYSLEEKTSSFVFIDLYAGTSDAVLKFPGNIITGINIIGNLLLWTDNINEPRKINIDECKKGTTINNNGTWNHTQLLFDYGSFDGITLDLITDNTTDPFVFLDEGERVWYDSKQLDAMLNTDGIPPGFTSIQSVVKHYRDTEYLGLKNVVIFDNNIGTYFHAVDNFTDLNIDSTAWQKGDVIFGNDITMDIEERHIIVVKQKPLNALSVKINYSDTVDTTSVIPNIFETQFPRFSYRYKYKDGEYSAFAPFTTPVFNPKYPKDTSVSFDSNIFYNKDNAYDIKDPSNKAMVNSIHSVELTDFITAKTPEDVIEIDILFKQEESNVIYSIDTVKQIDNRWHTQSNHEGLGVDLGLGKSDDTTNGTYKAHGSLTKGKYIVTTENIYAVLPENQLLRPWDNVPKKAQAQEVTGNRVVYGNYVQGYDIEEDVDIVVSYGDRINLNTFETQGLPHVKSQRNYQLGVVYCDKHGRETPVFTSTDGAVNIPWQDSSGNQNASKSLQLNSSIVTNFPEWVDSLKFFVKQTSNQYYNLSMERAWVTESTYELDNSEGHIYISFPSTDRNKITEEDYIILKKKIGTGEEQVSTENKYKVIDIKNEAPDVLKYQLLNLGVKPNDSNNTLAAATPTTSNSLFYKQSFRPDKTTNKLVISKDMWKHDDTLLTDFRSELSDMLGREGGIQKDLYVSWRRIGIDNSASKKYKVTGGWFASDKYVLNLQSEITSIDADIAHVNGNSSDTSQDLLHPDLAFQIEKRELRPQEDFSGKFFVKISKNQITDTIQSGGAIDVTKQFQVTAKNSSWYWQDNIASGSPTADITGDGTITNYGLLNYNGYQTTFTGIDDIHNINNNTVGDVDADGIELRVTDYHDAWEGIFDAFGPTFFVDSMHMAAGQSEASDNAKYCCITWAGLGGEPGLVDHTATSKTESAWSYPPLKTWITEFEDISGLRSKLKSNSVWFNDNLISTSPISESNKSFYNKKIDGWVGPLQKVDRHIHDEDVNSAPNIESPTADHINGLEGLVTTTDTHATGPRKWFSGITSNATEHGAGSDTNTYSANGEIDRHFMHLSFFAPGKDLHDGDFDGFSPDTTQALYGKNSWAAQLQGIWGGGVFTGENNTQKFGSASSSSQKHFHLAMENNHSDSGDKFKKEAPGPDVGYGYDKEYKELYERQWDPTFTNSGDDENKIRDFIRNLYPGSQFRFNKKSQNFVTSTVSSAVSASTSVVLDTDLYTASQDPEPSNFIEVGDLVSGDGVDSGTTIAAVNVGSNANAITLSANATIVAGAVLTFTSADGSVKVAENTDTEVYTIKKINVKKLYNHTSWRKPYNRYLDSEGGYVYTSASTNVDYLSVERVGLDWLNTVDATGKSTGATTEINNFKNKIVEFGASHNRRVCYIIELDKNPANTSNSNVGNPLLTENVMSADISNGNFCNIEFLDPVKDIFLSDLNKFPAIWETDPKKSKVDLDIYYEASSNIPVKINDKTNELFAPVGCTVEVLNSSITSSSIIQSWDNATATLHPGFSKYDVDENGNQTEIDYSNMSFKFIRQDGSYTVAEASVQATDPLEDEYKTKFIFKENIGDVITTGLSWYNCFSFGNGIESNRIRDDFNEIFIVNGVKASTTTQETYEEERRATSLIYSGIYNANSSLNDLNQFIMAEKITKDLNPTFGSIQKLFQRRISLIAFCEDRVVSIVANKDTIFNADGNPQLVASNKVLGDANPFSGEYGISKNPESFAAESYRTYFTDKQRGAVLRLSKDGLTPISKAGMHDWFRDNLTEYNSLIGTYDSYKEDYNLTLSNNNFSVNLLQDEYLDFGGDPIVNLDITNRIENPGVNDGTDFEYLYNTYDILNINDSTNTFNWDDFTAASYALTSSAYIIHHGAIAAGSLEPGVTGVPIVAPSDEGPVWFGGSSIAGNTATSIYGFDEPLASSGSNTNGLMIDLDYMSINLGNLGTSPNAFIGGYSQGGFDGTYHVHGYISSIANPNLTVANNQGYAYGDPIEPDVNIKSIATQGGTFIDPSNYTYNTYGVQIPPYYKYNMAFGYNDATATVVKKTVCFDVPMYDFDVSASWSNGNYQASVHNKPGLWWNRCGDGHWVEFGNFGIDDDNGNPTGDLVEQYLLDPDNVLDSTPGVTENTTEVTHSSCFAGEEIHVQIKLGLTQTFLTNQNSDYDEQYMAKHGYNITQPRIEIFDGATGAVVDPDIIADVNSFSFTTSDGNSLYEEQTATNILTGLPTAIEMQNGDVYADWDNDGNIRASTVDDITPFNCLHSTPFSGTDGDGGFTTTRYTTNTANYNGIWSDDTLYGRGYSALLSSTGTTPYYDGDVVTPDDYFDSFGWQENGSVLFSRTGCDIFDNWDVRNHENRFFNMTPFGCGIGQASINIAGVGLENNIREFTISCSFKLKKSTANPNQGASRDYEIGTPVEKVIDDLRIRLYNDEPETPSGNVNWYSPSWGELKKACFRIDSVKVVKGFGVIQTGIPEVLPVWQVHPVDPVPPVNIPAWTEVQHNYFTLPTPTWDITTNAGASVGNITSTHAEDVTVFGDNYPTQAATAFGADTNDPTLPPSTPINYVVPSGFDFTDDGFGNGTENPPGTVGTGTSGLGINFQAVQGSPTPPTPTINDLVLHDNNYIYIENPANGFSYVAHDISIEPWSIGSWYLVDVEWDQTHNPDAGITDGEVMVRGIGDGSGVPGQEVDIDGVGVWHTNGFNIVLLPVTRTEYGTQETVLRTIFKITNNSFFYNNAPTNFSIVVDKVVGGIKIKKIITKKLDDIPSAGDPVDWSSPASTAVHSFDNNTTYFKNSKLCWEIPLDSLSAAQYNNWSQSFANPALLHQGNWQLEFTVSNNPITNNFSGSLGGVMAIDNGDGFYRGISFTGIQQTGDYRINFDLDNAQDANDWTITRYDGANYIEYPNANIETAIDSVFNSSNTLNEIKFYNDIPVIQDQEYAVNNLSLVPTQNEFLVGEVGFWNTNGFDPAMVDPYVYLDNVNNYFVFDECPIYEPANTEFISISQQIVLFSGTNMPIQFDQYRISFTHGITSGKIDIYYYNSAGLGFRIESIDQNSAGNTAVDPNTTPFETIVSIGQENWNPVQPAPYGSFNADYKDTFVIVANKDNTENINGYIDNISMVRVYSETPDTTITFNESVNGWSSFKSFVPESGVSLSKKYFTLKQGGLYQHYVPKLDNATGYTDANGFFIKYTPDEANNYNIFYGENSHSSIKALLNQDPSSVKMFNTLNYEGSQAYIVKPTQDEITIDNAAAWGAGQDIQGWNCSEIKTNLDTGTVVEFIKKEGKWFNYIKGSNINQHIDTSIFSVQGIGMVSSVQSVGNGNGAAFRTNGGGGGTTTNGTTTPPTAPPATGGTTGGGGGGGGY